MITWVIDCWFHESVFARDRKVTDSLQIIFGYFVSFKVSSTFILTLSVKKRFLRIKKENRISEKEISHTTYIKLYFWTKIHNNYRLHVQKSFKTLWISSTFSFCYLTDAKNICKFQNVHHIAVLQQKLFICIRQKHHFITHYDTK